MTADQPARTPVRITSRYPAFRSGRLEIWSAESTDGVWTYERVEDVGTPWIVTYKPTGLDVWLSSLPKARAFTARPDAVEVLERIAAREDQS